MRLRWIVVVGAAGLLLALWQGNLTIAVLTVSTCLILVAVRNAVLRLGALEKYFGVADAPDNEDDETV
jgi:hypothetical protein